SARALRCFRTPGPARSSAYLLEKAVNAGVTMARGNGGDDSLIPTVCGEALFDLGDGGRGTGEISFVHDDDVRRVEHHDFLKLEPTAVVGTHDEDGLIRESAAERKRFLADANRLDEDDIEPTALHRAQPASGFRRQTARAAARGETAHEDAIILRMDHRRA